MLLATVSLWALNFTVSKYILDKGFHPISYSAIRYAAAALVFATAAHALPYDDPETFAAIIANFAEHGVRRPVARR